MLDSHWRETKLYTNIIFFKFNVVILIIIEKKTNSICADSKTMLRHSTVKAFVEYKLKLYIKISKTKLLLQSLYII